MYLFVLRATVLCQVALTEDMKRVPIYLKTTEILADIGTKALDPKLFCYLRDKLCGYWRGL